MPVRYILRAILLIAVVHLSATALDAQEVDGRFATRDTAVKQHWPGVFVRGNKVYVRWGEAKPSANPNIHVDEIWYDLGEWTRRTDNAGDVLDGVLPLSLAADPGATVSLVSVTTRTDPGEFDGANVGGSMQWRGDVVPGPSGNDSIYKARFDVYIPRGPKLERVVVYEASRRQVVTLRLRTFAYNTSTGELLAAWVNSVDANGYVTCIDTSGAIKWSFNTMPLPAGAYQLIPVRDREFIIVHDTVGIRYRDGNPVDTTIYPLQPFSRFRRLLGDRFIRTYRSADTAHYTMELYSTDGTMLKTCQIFRPNAQSTYFTAENSEDGGIGFVAAGPDGVYATVVDKDLIERAPMKRISKSTDSAFSPSAAFFGDTLYTAWQDNRDTVPRIYCRAFATGTFVFGVDDNVDAPIALAVKSVTPNPASATALIDVTVPTNGKLALELYDMSGRLIVTRSVEVSSSGRRSLPLDVAGLSAGSYRVVVRQSGHTASSVLQVVR